MHPNLGEGVWGVWGGLVRGLVCIINFRRHSGWGVGVPPTPSPFLFIINFQKDSYTRNFLEVRLPQIVVDLSIEPLSPAPIPLSSLGKSWWLMGDGGTGGKRKCSGWRMIVAKEKKGGNFQENNVLTISVRMNAPPPSSLGKHPFCG